MFLINMYLNNISIHDLTRRSTQNAEEIELRATFQFTTSQGGRRRLEFFSNRQRHFNSRPHKEVD